MEIKLSVFYKNLQQNSSIFVVSNESKLKKCQWVIFISIFFKKKSLNRIYNCEFYKNRSQRKKKSFLRTEIKILFQNVKVWKENLRNFIKNNLAK